MEVYMKKIFLITGLILFSAIAVVAADNVKYSSIFINKFYHCLPTNQTITLTNDDNTSVTITRSMHGWKEKKCVYNETVMQGENTTSYNCNLYREQVNELVSAMRSDPNGEGLAEQTWERFKKLPDVCTKLDAQ